MISSSIGRPFASPETLPEKKLGTFSQAALASGGVVEGLAGEGEGVGKEVGAGFGEELIERIEGGGVGVDAIDPLKKSVV